MTKSLSFLLAGCLLVCASFAQSGEGYHLFFDLVDTEDGRVPVSLSPPQLRSDSAVFNMPKIIPGTYSISDFGRFVEDFSAVSSSGDTLPHLRIDTNRWAVLRAQELDHIAYRVSDTFSKSMGAGIFEPGGTSIEPDKVVLLNAFGFAGYFEGLKDIPYTVEVKRPETWYGATSLPRIKSQDQRDFFRASGYYELHDCPVLYAKPDTSSAQVANAKIMVAVYSPNEMVKSAEVLDEVIEIFEASARYLGGTLPVEQYSLLIYLSGSGSYSRSYGALEHNTSTVFVLPEAPLSALAETIRDVAAHEFFHIVTPLSIHSEMIHDYDFVYPRMSAHLWLYEGCTEYAAQHVQVKEGLVELQRFLDNMRAKMMAADRYRDDIAFTELSRKALDEFKNEYPNVYQKGALIGMALDLKLRSLSDGEYGTQALMADLSEAYGRDRPFLDDSLFSVIARISGFPQIEDFLERHVGGTERIPFGKLFEPFGILYADSLNYTEITAGSLRLGYNPRREAIVLASKKGADEFGESLGLEVGDEIVKWNGVALTLDNLEQVLKDFKKASKVGDKVKVQIARKSNDYKKETIKAKAMEVTRTKRHYLDVLSEVDEDQIRLRKAWAGQ